VAAVYAIADVAWADRRDPTTWASQVTADALTSPLLHRLRAALGDP